MTYTAEQIRQLAKEHRLKEFYTSIEWRRLALSVIKEHHYECARCKANGRLTRADTVHHIKYLKTVPELAYEHTNLMPLCRACHEEIHGRSAGSHGGYDNEERW